MESIKCVCMYCMRVCVRVCAYSRLLVGHEDSVAGQVVTRAGGVCVVGVQQAAALRGPPATPRGPRRVPERTVGAKVVLQL